MKYLTIWSVTIYSCFAEFNSSVDLSHVFDKDTIYWPGMPTFDLEDVLREEDPYMLAKKFAAAEHGGTHLDAPLHFNPDGWDVAHIPLDRLIVTGVVIQMRDAAAKDRDVAVSVQDLQDWEKTYGALPEPVAVIFDFGWSSKYNNKTEYLGTSSDNEKDLHFPGVSEEAADWLVKSGKVVGVGVDTASIDPGNNTEFIAHQRFAAADIYMMENLALAEADLPPRGFQLIVMPMKIFNGTGAPLRIVAQPDMKLAISIFSKILSWVLSVWVCLTSVFK